MTEFGIAAIIVLVIVIVVALAKGIAKDGDG